MRSLLGLGLGGLGSSLRFLEGFSQHMEAAVKRAIRSVGLVSYRI